MSTLYRFLRARGLDHRAAPPRADHRAFEFELPGDCWQGDVMYGPTIAHPDGSRRKTHLIATSPASSATPSSGAAESTIRRVVNLRVKGAGMFREEANVEAVMYLRAQAATNRWEGMLKRVQEHAMRTRELV